MSKRSHRSQRPSRPPHRPGAARAQRARRTGIVATARTPEASDLADRGVVVRHADYDEPAEGERAFAGADRVLLVSSSAVGAANRTAPQRRRRRARGWCRPDRLTRANPRGHHRGCCWRPSSAATERLIRDSGLGLRVPPQLAVPGELHRAARHDAGAQGDPRQRRERPREWGEPGRLRRGSSGGTRRRRSAQRTPTSSAATRRSPWASTPRPLSGLVGEPIAYVDQPPAQYQAFLESVGMPEPIARVMADSDVAVARGDLLVESGDLSRLIGRPTTGLADAIRTALG